MTRVVIIGGGSIAHALAAVLGARRDVDAVVVTRRPDAWSNCIVAYNGSSAIVGGIAPTDDVGAVRGSDLVLVAAPAFAHRDILSRLKQHLDPATWIGALPAVGGFDAIVEATFPGHQKVLGSLRSPYNARVREYGRVVEISGIVPCMDIVAIEPALASAAASFVGELLTFSVRPLTPFVLATIAPGSTIFHPARILELLAQDDASGQRFYGDWGEMAAGFYLEMDAELSRLRSALCCEVEGIDAHSHYGTSSTAALAARIRSLSGLPDIATPFCGNRLDPAHRFVREDLTSGLTVTLEIAARAGVATPVMQRARSRILENLPLGTA